MPRILQLIYEQENWITRVVAPSGPKVRGLNGRCLPLSRHPQRGRDICFWQHFGMVRRSIPKWRFMGLTYMG